MKRLANYDVSRRYSDAHIRLLVQLAFGVGCALAMIGMRSLLDFWTPTAGPFALVYPTVLIATLYGHWRAGLTAYVLSFLWAWYFALAPVESFQFQVASDPSRVAINAAAALVLVLLAEIWRRAATSAVAERDEEIAHRKLLQEDLEHRTKNNFALAASLLAMQKRQEDDPEIVLALDQAIARIQSFASAYANLAQTQAEGALVRMDSYLVELVDRVTRGAFHDNVAIKLNAVPHSMPREVAVAIGLFTNEALTNAAKYAFPDGRNGTIDIRFDASEAAWSLDIVDDGVGEHRSEAESKTPGIGSRLLVAFANQAQADYKVDVSPKGRALRLSTKS